MDKTLENVAKKHHIKLILKFGSEVTGKTHAASDLDLAVLFDPSLTELHKRFFEAWIDLEEFFPGKKLDLALLNHADPFFLHKIMENYQLVFGDKRDLDELNLYAFKRYQDHKPYLKLEQEYVQRFIKRIA